MLLTAAKTGITFVATFHMPRAAPNYGSSPADTKLQTKPLNAALSSSHRQPTCWQTVMNFCMSLLLIPTDSPYNGKISNLYSKYNANSQFVCSSNNQQNAFLALRPRASNAFRKEKSILCVFLALLNWQSSCLFFLVWSQKDRAYKLSSTGNFTCKWSNW
jgi:hypothetical protein